MSLRTEVMLPPDPANTSYRHSSEVLVGVDEGLKHDSAVNLDHVQTVEQSRLTGRLGHLGPANMRDVCRALAIATGCAD